MPEFMFQYRREQRVTFTIEAEDEAGARAAAEACAHYLDSQEDESSGPGELEMLENTVELTDDQREAMIAACLDAASTAVPAESALEHGVRIHDAIKARMIDDQLNAMLARARRHGEEGPVEDGATHEVGDLQQILGLAWARLDAAGRAHVYREALALVYDNEPEGYTKAAPMVGLQRDPTSDPFAQSDGVVVHRSPMLDVHGIYDAISAHRDQGRSVFVSAPMALAHELVALDTDFKSLVRLTSPERRFRIAASLSEPGTVVITSHEQVSISLVGINCSSADVLVLIDPPSNQKTLEQIRSRVNRAGRTRPLITVEIPNPETMLDVEG
jgi:hypothetical protein